MKVGTPMFSVEPIELVRTAGRLTELSFGREHGRDPWLLVRLGGDDEELAAALRAAEASAATAAPGKIAFHTEIVSEALRLKRGGAQATEPDWQNIVKSLGDARYYAVAVRKRPGVDAAFGDRVSVGRALNKDIAFRHASISKFHAYFQIVDSEHCRLADAGSKNGTIVNGVPLSKDGVDVVSGDHVTFGSITTIVLDARTLWRVLRAK